MVPHRGMLQDILSELGRNTAFRIHPALAFLSRLTRYGNIPEVTIGTTCHITHCASQPGGGAQLLVLLDGSLRLNVNTQW